MAEKEAKELETPVVAEETTEAPAEEKFAKAGKKSKKHVEEVKAEEERQARKLEAAALVLVLNAVARTTRRPQKRSRKVKFTILTMLSSLLSKQAQLSLTQP